eukprot:12408392-Prorocentrum_lima.AAC.1
MEKQLLVKRARQPVLCGAIPFVVRGGQNGACVIDKSWSNSGAAHFFCSVDKIGQACRDMAGGRRE